MAVTVEELAERLQTLEQDVAHLKALADRTVGPETPAERGARWLAEADRGESALRASARGTLEAMGITEPPVPVDELRRMIQECGVKPEERLLSRGIVEMREE